jgi:uncharacterized protein
MLTSNGHQVLRLARGAGDSGSPTWDPKSGQIDAEALEGLDAVVHLAGENLASGRWTARRKQQIRDSRVQGTQLLTRALAQRSRKPRTLICASAVGFYGDRGERVLDEQSGPGHGFVAEVCQQWEQAADPARQAGIRVVHLRFGMVISGQGGALPKMLLPFRMGLGGPVGSGKQYWAWISIDDAVGAIHHAMVNEILVGPVNTVAPAAATSRQFASTLGRVLRRPAVLPMPAFAARLAFGQMADEVLLASARVDPSRLRLAGYQFRHEDLEPALRHALGR